MRESYDITATNMLRYYLGPLRSRLTQFVFFHPE